MTIGRFTTEHTEISPGFQTEEQKERKNRLCLAACGIFRTVYVPGSSVRKSTYSKQNMKTFTSILVLLFGLQAATAQPLQRVAPEQAGLDSRKLMYADEAIETAIAGKEIPGAVLAVVRNGKMAYLKAYGNKRIYPDTEPMTVNTIFDMASCSKSISTAVCTMILAERGKNTPARPCKPLHPRLQGLGERRRKKTKKVIRIADLLTHSSGLPPYASAAELEQKYGSPNPAGLMEYIAGCKRDFKPQTGFQYSCLNFITLQHIIEAVSGQSLRDFARENVFDVLGMKHTDYLPCLRDKNGKWINTVPLPENIAPTEKTTRRAGSLRTGARPACTHSQRRHQRQCRRILLRRRYCHTLRRPAKWRRVERTSHSQPARRKDHAHRTPCYSRSGPLTGLGCM